MVLRRLVQSTRDYLQRGAPLRIGLLGQGTGPRFTPQGRRLAASLHLCSRPLGVPNPPGAPPNRAVRNPYPDFQRTLFEFTSPADLALWNVFSDSEYGGRSTAALQLSQEEPVRRLVVAVCVV